MQKGIHNWHNRKWKKVFIIHNFKNTESWEDKASNAQRSSDTKVAPPPTSLVLQLLLQDAFWKQTTYRAGASHSSALGKIHFQRPLICYDVILLNQPWHDLFKRKQTHSLCALYILNWLVRPSLGKVHSKPLHRKSLLRTIFLHQTNLFDSCRVYLNKKFIKILSTHVTGVAAFKWTSGISTGARSSPRSYFMHYEAIF